MTQGPQINRFHRSSAWRACPAMMPSTRSRPIADARMRSPGWCPVDRIILDSSHEIRNVWIGASETGWISDTQNHKWYVGAITSSSQLFYFHLSTDLTLRESFSNCSQPFTTHNVYCSPNTPFLKLWVHDSPRWSGIIKNPLGFGLSNVWSV